MDSSLASTQQIDRCSSRTRRSQASSMASLQLQLYSHSAVHFCIARHDLAALRSLLAELSPLPPAGQVLSEEDSEAAEEKARSVSALIDRRDVPGGETPLHLAVRLGDAAAVEMLAAAGADLTLQNEQGWSALQEAVCARKDAIARVLSRYYLPMAWTKWCRRLPRVAAAMRRVRDFYTEIAFTFESSVIPFISRIAPSDTYRIWKRGSNLRADMTLAGLDGLKLLRSDRSLLFFGDGTHCGDAQLPSGSLLLLSHKDREIVNILEDAGALPPSEDEASQSVPFVARTTMYRLGIDVTQAELLPQQTWRWQERTEMVGSWNAKLFDLSPVLVSVRSRKVSGACLDDECSAAEIEAQRGRDSVCAELLSEKEQQQLEDALLHKGDDEFDDDGLSRIGILTAEGAEGALLQNEFYDGLSRVGIQTAAGALDKHSDEACSASSSAPFHHGAPLSSFEELKKAWRKKAVKREAGKKNSSAVRSHWRWASSRRSGKQPTERDWKSHGTEKAVKRNGSKRKPAPPSNGHLEIEYKKTLKPVVWLTADFPMETQELLPLLDVLAHNVKAFCRLKELLTTRLPSGTFPVKVAIPIIPTIRLVVTFNRFEELPATQNICTAPSSPRGVKLEMPNSSSAQITRMRDPREQMASPSLQENHAKEAVDPFIIPRDYTWADMKETNFIFKANNAKS